MGDCLRLPENKLLIWERGAPHRREPQSAPIWCLKTDEIIGTLEGHPSWILGAVMIDDNHILSWSAGRVLITDIERPDEGIELQINGSISGIKRVEDDRILCWGSNGVTLWTLSTRTRLGHWLEGETVSTADLRNDTLLVGTRTGFRPGERSGCFHGIALGRENQTSTPILDEWAKGGIQLSDELALCWAKNFMFLWDLETGSFEELPHDTDIGGAICISDGTLFSWQSGPPDSRETSRRSVCIPNRRHTVDRDWRTLSHHAGTSTLDNESR